MYRTKTKQNQRDYLSILSDNSIKKSPLNSEHSLIDFTDFDAESNPLAKKAVAYSYGEKPVFSYEYSFGYDSTKAFVNLTEEFSNMIGLITSNMLILYDYKYGTMAQLSGHTNNLLGASVAETGRWLATCSTGNRNRIVVWDLMNGVPLKSLLINNLKAANLQMSPTGKYLAITLDEQPQILLFYIWSSQCNQPQAIVKFDKNVTSILSVNFCKKCEEYLVVTAANSVIFLTFNGDNLECYNPKENDAWPNKPVEYVCSVYHDEINVCYSAACKLNKGVLIVWGDDSILERPLTDNEYHIYEQQKDVPATNLLDGKLFLDFHEYRIVSMKFVDRYLVCVDERSHINFYDITLQSVYTFKELANDGIFNIQMNLMPRKFTDDPAADKKLGGCSPAFSRFIDNFKAYSKKKIDVDAWRDVSDVVAKQKEADKDVLRIRDMIIQTKNDKLYYFNPITEKLYRIFRNSIHDASAMACSPLRTTVCIGTFSGYIYLFEYFSKDKLVERKLYGKNCPEAAGITALQYSHNGYILACGLSDGTLYCLHPYTLQESKYPEKCAHVSTAPIHIIQFCRNSAYLAYADRNMMIGLFAVARKFTCIGYFKAHYDTIKDMTFASVPSSTKLYSVAKDRYLNEFDVAECLRIKGVEVRRRIRLSLEAIPLTISPSAISEKLLIISLTNHAFHTIDTDTMQLVDIKRTPSLIFPVHMFKDLSNGILNGSKSYLFASGSKIGLMKGPIDGNPFKWVIVVTGTSKITALCTSKRSCLLFAVTKNHPHVHMWRINPSCLDSLENVGGRGLKPYYALLQGGKYNPIVGILEDMYCLALIQHQGAYTMDEMELKKDKTIPLCELPNLLRALGVFLSNAQIEEIIDMYSFKSKLIHEQKITFEEVALLFFNLKQDNEFTYDRIKQAFHIICAYNGEKHREDNPSIIREEFIKCLEEEGEKFTPLESYNYFRILTGHKEGDHYFNNGSGDMTDYKFLSPRITFKYFADQLLGFNAEEEHFEVDDPSLEPKLNKYPDEPLFIKAMSQIKQSFK